MAKKCRRTARHGRGSVWKHGNTIERRSTIGLGCLNVNGWDEVTKYDVEAAMNAMNIDVFSLVETNAKKKPGENRPVVEVEGCKVYEVRRQRDGDRVGGGVACVVRKVLGVVVTRYEPKISNPDLAYVSAERLWIKYKSDQGWTAICTTYLGFQAIDDRHQDWNEGIYEVLAEEIRSLRGEGYRVILQGDFNA